MSKRVRDFDPAYIRLWRQASLRDVVLPAPDRETAISFRHRLHQLRKAMRAERHEALGDAEKVKIKIEYLVHNEWHAYTNDQAATKRGFDLRGASWRLRMTNTGAAFDSVLEAAGYPKRGGAGDDENTPQDGLP